MFPSASNNNNNSDDNTNKRRRTHSPGNMLINSRSALNGHFEMHKFLASQNGDYDIVLEDVKEQLVKFFDNMDNRHAKSFKIAIVVRCTFERLQDNSKDHFIRSKTVKLFNLEQDLNSMLRSSISDIRQQIENFEGIGSGWIFKRVHDFTLEMTKYYPLAGGNHISCTRLPPTLAGCSRKSLLNIKCNDEKCFLWSILAHYYRPEQNQDRLSNYTPYRNEIDMQGKFINIQTSNFTFYFYFIAFSESETTKI